MAFTFLTALFGSRNSRILKQYQKTLRDINALEGQFTQLSDEQLRAMTDDLKSRYQATKNLDSLLVEAFALVREASRRVLNMRHFDVQILGGIAIHQGKIAEMGTGEGKTLMATLPVYLNALTGLGVHLITVNDYLAKRDAEWMGKLYQFLGLSVGINLTTMSNQEKQQAYLADIVYGTNNEFGFDYLRDNMVYALSERVQRGLHFAIVDEVDSILIDEARTPLIISGAAEEVNNLYLLMNDMVPLLTKQIGEADPRTGEGVLEEGDFIIDEKSHQVHLTDKGHETVEKILIQKQIMPADSSLYAVSHINLLHHLNASLRAHYLFHKDQHYVIQNDSVIIVDEFTGRLMPGRRWSDGLHQAIEAKEGVHLQAENKTLASITFQNYFRLYQKLAGMTGTADTEAYEFQQIYTLETVVIPPNKKCIRDDQNDRVYKSLEEKFEAVVAAISECNKHGQPVLVGTSSIENSEIVSRMLSLNQLKHQVLNAKYHEREADIVAQAGTPYAITISTNMAGRGTDIVLGGNIQGLMANIQNDPTLTPEIKEIDLANLKKKWREDHEFVKSQGGLKIIGTERHESRRIDNQLRGRSGRQGDPGASRFYLSMDDSLLRIFAGERVKGIMEKLRMPRGEAIEAGLINRSIESAQRKVEARNFDIRKQLLEYDDVSNEQRKVVYSLRNYVIDNGLNVEQIDRILEEVVQDLCERFIPKNSVEEQWDLVGLEKKLAEDWQSELKFSEMMQHESSVTPDSIVSRVTHVLQKMIHSQIDKFEVARINFTYLFVVDKFWREHITTLDYLRQGIHLRGYAQKQPKQEYKREAYELFMALLKTIKTEFFQRILLLRELENHGSEESAQPLAPDSSLRSWETVPKDESHRVAEKVGRNDPCPCNSGKKFKLCHGKLT
ncbi:MAG: preprotein translocase subunit SecA [Gammaproteobacteria bacterium]|nr:preprotein translocase subunit SecA [Gammaproteobacteria bacterium]